VTSGDNDSAAELMRRGEQEESMRSPCRAGENAPTGLAAGTRIAASGSAEIDGIIIVRWQ